MSKLKHLAAVVAVGGTLAAGITLTASATRAEMLDFSLSLSNGDSETWTQSSAPTPVEYGSQRTEISVSNSSGSFGTLSTVDFNTSGQPRGGILIEEGNSIYAFEGPVIYGGTLAAPTFAPGSFNLTGESNVTGTTATLTITAVPEPATWVMMLTGVFGLGAALRVRSGKRLYAAGPDRAQSVESAPTGAS